MNPSGPSLGLCFYGNQLFYAVKKPDQPGSLARIGSVDFNFNVTSTIYSGNSGHFSGLEKTVRHLKEQYEIDHIRILSFPDRECWTVLPRLVYDEPDERESYIDILMKGSKRSEIEATWYDISNSSYKFLLLRNRTSVPGLQKLAALFSTADLISDFEIGQHWIQHTNTKGSFMTIGCYDRCISVSSYLLGKLRGAVHINFDDYVDLPYLWLQYSKHLQWMQGLHEQIYLYGIQAYRVMEVLEPFWDDASRIIKMDTLGKMQVGASEKTYSFGLELAFPAIMLSMEN